MINNRQNGRRRGRGGTRPPNGPNNAPERGNRLDNRARGNASQLHEKYKTLARDAQMQGDRVMTEYYLQFADHYFRILGESRARFEEQRRYRDEGSDFDDEDGDSEMNAGFDGDDGGQDYRQPPRQNDVRRNEGRQDGRQNESRQNEGRQNQARQNDSGQNDGRQYDGRQDGRGRDPEQSGAEPRRRDERPRNDRPNEPRERDAPRQPEQRGNGPEQRGNGNVGHERQVDVRPADAPAGEPLVGEQEPAVAHAPVERARRPRVRRDRTEPPAEAGADAVPERIEVDRLPPSFAPAAPAPVEEAAAGEEESPRRRRTRRPRTDGAPVDA